MSDVRSSVVGPRQNIVASVVVVEPTTLTIASDGPIEVRVEATATREKLFGFSMRSIPRTVTIYEDARVLAFPAVGSARVSVWVEPAKVTT